VDAADDDFGGQDFGSGQIFRVFHRPYLTPDRSKWLP
jgi:hypothetical protein